MAKYRLLAGTHTTGSTAKNNRRRYHVGDIIESDEDLVKRFNRANSVKFEVVPDSNGGVSDGLDDMTVEELRQLAEAEEIDLGDAVRKPRIIRILREAQLPA